MTQQAGHKNFTVSTGAANEFAVRFHQRGDLVNANTVLPGGFIEFENAVWPVYSIYVPGTGKVTLKLGYGSFHEPEITLNWDDKVVLTPPQIWEDTDMQVALPDTEKTPAPATYPVPTSIDSSGEVCVININQEWLNPIQQAIDWLGGGPSGMSLPYDLVGLFAGQRIRVLTGSIIIVRSAASPFVPPPAQPK